MNDTLTKAFPTEYVLSAITGVLVCKIDGVYEMLTWMSGESVYTHQLPRIGREAAPVVLAMHPHLQVAVDESASITPENYREYLDRWLDRYGPEITVPKMTADDHERIDPVSELAEKVHPDKIILVAP